MLKFLLPEQRNKIKAEYIRRYSILAIFLFSIVLIIFAFSLTPTLLLTRSENKLLKEQIRVAKSPELNEDKENLKKTLNEISGLIEILDKNKGNYEISSIIDQITKSQIRGITISSISIKEELMDEKKDINYTMVEIQGRASGREVLANFVSALENIEDFEKVELPFSSFAINEDVPFNLKITLASLDEENV